MIDHTINMQTSDMKKKMQDYITDMPLMFLPDALRELRSLIYATPNGHCDRCGHEGAVREVWRDIEGDAVHACLNLHECEQRRHKAKEMHDKFIRGTPQ